MLVRRGEEVRGIAGVWTVVVVIHPPKRPNFNAWLDHLGRDIHKVQTKGQAGSDDLQMWKDRIDFMTNNLDEFNLTVDLAKIPGSRPRRSPFDFVSSISRQLFGFDTQGQIDTLTNAIRASQDRIEALTHHGADMVSVMNQTRRYLQENRMDIKTLQEASTELSARIDKNLVLQQGLARTINSMHIRRHVDSIIDQVDRSIHLYLHQVGLFHRQRLQLERGFLTDEILPPSFLYDVIRQLHFHKLESAPLHWYYKYAILTPLVNKGTELSFKVDIAGLAPEKYLQYILNYFPVPLDDNHLRMISGTPEIALDTASSGTFVPEHCTGNNPKVCRIDQEQLEPTCESNLIMGKALTNCVLTVVPRNNRTSIIYRETDHLAIVVLAAFRPTETTLYCKDKTPLSKTYTGINKIKVGPGCVLQTKAWRIRGIDRGQTYTEIPVQSYLPLPSINLTFPSSFKTAIYKQLKFSPRVDIPLINKDSFSENEPIFQNFTPMERGALAGTPALLLIIIIVSVLIIYYKIVGCKRCCVRRREETQVKQVHSEHPAPNNSYGQTNFHINSPAIQASAPRLNQHQNLYPLLPPSTGISTNPVVQQALPPPESLPLMGQGAEDPTKAVYNALFGQGGFTPFQRGYSSSII